MNNTFKIMDYTKITTNQTVIRLFKQILEIEKEIKRIDKEAIMKYKIELKKNS